MQQGGEPYPVSRREPDRTEFPTQRPQASRDLPHVDTTGLNRVRQMPTR